MGACCEKQQLPPETSFQDNLVRKQNNDFDDIYSKVEPLGTGAISTIYKIQKKDSALGGSSQEDFVKRKRKTGNKRLRSSKAATVPDEDLTRSLRGPEQYYALKEIDINKVNGELAMKSIRNEVEILKSIDHPNIIRAFEVFEVDKRLSMTMEYCRGGDISTRSPYSERQVAIIIRQVLSAVSYMHKREFAHRDIKIENILYQSDDPDNWRIKLIDLGLSKKYSSEPLREKVGTLYAMAPEALEGGYKTFKVDLWSIGVVAYLLISGDRPFRGDTPEEMASNILEQELAFDSQIWKLRSAECKDFISLLLQKDPKLRPDTEVALNHPWFLKHADDSRARATEDVLDAVRENLVRYKSNGDFKRLALNVMAKRLGSDELQDVRDIFLDIDEGNDGFITMDEFKKVLQDGSAGRKEYSDEDIEGIFGKLDINCTGVITWTEFVAGTLEAKGALEEHRLADAFDLIDMDDSGYISKQNLRTILGKHYSEEYLAKLMSEADANRNGKISYMEFKRAFVARQPKGIEFAVY